MAIQSTVAKPFTLQREFPGQTGYCTEVRYSSFLSGIFTTMAVINPPEKNWQIAPLSTVAKPFKVQGGYFGKCKSDFCLHNPICLQGFTTWANDDRALNGMEEIIQFFKFNFDLILFY